MGKGADTRASFAQAPFTRKQFLRAAARGSGLAFASLVVPKDSYGQQPHIRIAVGRAIASSPLWNMAKHAPQYGISVEAVALFTYADQQRAVSNNQAQTGTSGITNPAIIADQGIQNLRVIAGGLFGGANLVIRKAVNVSTWKDLEGKSVGVVPGTYGRIILQIAAEEGGASLDKIKFTNLSVGATALEALRKGDVDGFVLFAPTTEQAVLEGIAYYPAGLNVGESSLGPANGIIIANAELLSNKEVAVNFLKAYVASLNELKDLDAFIKVAMPLGGVTEAVAREAFRNFYYAETIDVKAIVGAAKLGPRFGFTKSDQSDKVASLVDFGPLSMATGKPREQLVGTPAAALEFLRR